jgi:hypothetical protein
MQVKFCNLKFNLNPTEILDSESFSSIQKMSQHIRAYKKKYKYKFVKDMLRSA